MAFSLEALIFGKQRSVSDGIETIIPNVVVTEEHTDEVQVTRHPVDVGAPVSDHAFVASSVLRVQFGWSLSASLVNAIMPGSLFRAASSGTSPVKGISGIEDVYRKILDLLEKRELLTISTGKRQYTNMLLTRVQTTTSAETENALLLDLTFERVWIATPTTITLSEDQVFDPSRTGSIQAAVPAYPLPGK